VRCGCDTLSVGEDKDGRQLQGAKGKVREKIKRHNLCRMKNALPVDKRAIILSPAIHASMKRGIPR
jgi:hypothetical protein